MIKKILFLFLLFSLIIPLANSEEVCKIEDEACNSFDNKDNDLNIETSHDKDSICIVYFYGDGCPKCAEIEPFLEKIEERYKDKIHITKYEVYHNLKNYQLYSNYCSVQNIPLNERGIPLLAIGNDFFMGVDQIEDNLENKINEMLETGDKICPLEGEMSCHEVNIGSEISPIIPGLKDKITLPLIIVTGLIDGINPCAFAVLIFLLTFLLSVSNKKRRMLKAGIVYILAVYVTYFLAGLGLLSIIQVSGLSRIIVKVAASLAILAGIINVKDYFWYGKGFSLKIPESGKKIIENLTKKANIPAAIVLGFLVSMFELPCTGGVYLAILAMMANSVARIEAIGYLLLYNLMFILPLIIILIAIYFGMKAEHIENWRKSKRNLMKLVLGLLLFGLGLGLLLGWF